MNRSRSLLVILALALLGDPGARRRPRRRRLPRQERADRLSLRLLQRRRRRRRVLRPRPDAEAEAAQRSPATPPTRRRPSRRTAASSPSKATAKGRKRRAPTSTSSAPTAPASAPSPAASPATPTRPSRPDGEIDRLLARSGRRPAPDPPLRGAAGRWRTDASSPPAPASTPNRSSPPTASGSSSSRTAKTDARADIYSMPAAGGARKLLVGGERNQNGPTSPRTAGSSSSRATSRAACSSGSARIDGSRAPPDHPQPTGCSRSRCFVNPAFSPDGTHLVFEELRAAPAERHHRLPPRRLEDEGVRGSRDRRRRLRLRRRRPGLGPGTALRSEQPPGPARSRDASPRGRGPGRPRPRFPRRRPVPARSPRPSRRARVVVGLEGLEDAVAAVFVDRRLVGEADPLGALVGLHVEDLLVDRGGVVDDDHDLGLRVEVGARLDQQLLDLVEVLLGVRRPSARSYVSGEGVEIGELALGLGLDVERLEAGGRGAVRCGRRPAGGPRPAAPRRPPGRRGGVASTAAAGGARLGLDVERRLAAPPRRSAFAASIWRTSAAWIAGSTGGGAVRSSALGGRGSIANGPLPIGSQARPERAKAIAAIGATTTVKSARRSPSPIAMAVRSAEGADPAQGRAPAVSRPRFRGPLPVLSAPG